MRLNELLKSKFLIEEAILDIQRLTDNPSELGDYLINEKLPLFILTFNHKRADIAVADVFKNIARIIFVCSTDDPYLENFKIELKDHEEILIFNKADYVGDVTQNGDDHGLTYPYNQCGCFARRFIDDYTQKNNLQHYMVTDNDLKIGIRKYDGKRYPMDDSTLSNAVRTYFYILDKYDAHFSWLNAATLHGEIGGKIYKDQFDVANLMFYFHNKPIFWRSRIHDDFLTTFLTLRDTGRMAFSFPYLRAEPIAKEFHGDMTNAYDALGDDKFFNYDLYFFPELREVIEKKKKLTKSPVLKSLLNKDKP